MELTIASWNIAGGCTSRSQAQFDYEQEDLGYFAEILKKENPDLVCLQETHTNDQRSLAAELAALLDMPYVYNSPASPSHIDPAYQLGNAIISRVAFADEMTIFHPDPWFELRFKDGRLAPQHPKNVQLVRIGDTYIGNTHLLSMGLFGYAYDDGGFGEALATQIEIGFLGLPEPLLLAGDFNYPDPERLFPSFLNPESFVNVPFDPELSRDHMFASPSLNMLNHRVIPSLSDHNLNIATFEIS